MAQCFSDLYNSLTSRSVSVEEATYLKSHLQLSTREWTDLRIALSKYVRLPTAKEIRAYTRTFLPEPYEKHNGIFVDVYDVVELTLKRLPFWLQTKLAERLEDGSRVTVLIACGLDASGGHRSYNSPTSLDGDVKTTHMFFGGLCLVYIRTMDGTQEELFRNKSSVDTERPVIIFPGGDRTICDRTITITATLSTSMK